MNDSDKKAAQVLLVIGAIILIAVVTPALSDGGRSSAGSIPFVLAIVLLFVAFSLSSRSETSDGGFAGSDYVDDVDDDWDGDVDDDASLGVSDGGRIRREAAEERRKELEELAELRKEVAELRRKQGARKPSKPEAPRPVMPAKPKRARKPQRARAIENSTMMRLACIENSIGMRLAMIPAGKFMMGSPDSDEDAGDNEKPQHLVRLTKLFCLGVCLVTQAQYQRVMGRNPSYHVAGRWGRTVETVREHPVESVSWEDATEFCDKLSALPEEQSAGRAYRLPTEAEWEYVCRAGSSTSYFFARNRYAAHAILKKGTYPVGVRKPNSWGLYDMPGNVWEWCSDWFTEKYYVDSPVDDPVGPISGSLRVHRGGSFRTRLDSRSAKRCYHSPGYRAENLGFRVALDPAE